MQQKININHKRAPKNPQEICKQPDENIFEYSKNFLKKKIEIANKHLKRYSLFLVSEKQNLSVIPLFNSADWQKKVFYS